MVKDPSFHAIPERVRTAASRAAPGANAGPQPDPAWSKDIRDYYNAVMQEPVPQELLDLLARIATDKAE
ncbi:NepR family anti-sigma factor [Novosphingobium sp.]|uniref:NepR family anti-sigma factor n=1 Tax=Novosphingobium sp. TaxID=1874826 RepID=UPI002604413E|nr:NepR family anti-sigma factor [Novosphingobium sp.]